MADTLVGRHSRADQLVDEAARLAQLAGRAQRGQRRAQATVPLLPQDEWTAYNNREGSLTCRRLVGDAHPAIVNCKHPALIRRPLRGHQACEKWAAITIHQSPILQSTEAEGKRKAFLPFQYHSTAVSAALRRNWSMAQTLEPEEKGAY